MELWRSSTCSTSAAIAPMLSIDDVLDTVLWHEVLRVLSDVLTRLA
jgi:hypothetical protein